MESEGAEEKIWWRCRLKKTADRHGAANTFLSSLSFSPFPRAVVVTAVLRDFYKSFLQTGFIFRGIHGKESDKYTPIQIRLNCTGHRCVSGHCGGS